jgi:hypothetical protein
MDRQSFDTLVRSLFATTTRRRLLSFAAGGGVATLLFPLTI